jgi:hypothetical protein
MSVTRTEAGGDASGGGTTMDDGHFDAWTRRRFGLGLGGLAAGLLGVAAPGAAAKKGKPKDCSKKKKQKCRRQGRVCEKGKCVVVCNARNSACRADVVQICGNPRDFCVCSPLAGGGFTCAEQRPDECPAFSECIGDLDCAGGEACVDVSGDNCCGSEKIGICRKRCKAGSPGL